MPIKQATPYLFFNGTAEKAIALYQRALNAKPEGVMRFGEAPGEKPPAPAQRDLVMHAVLRLGDTSIMLSDSTPEHPVGRDGNVQISLEIDDERELERSFGALAEGGQVTMPLHDAFWGARFGMVKDAYGVGWMLSCSKKAG